MAENAEPCNCRAAASAKLSATRAALLPSFSIYLVLLDLAMVELTEEIFRLIGQVRDCCCTSKVLLRTFSVSCLDSKAMKPARISRR